MEMPHLYSITQISQYLCTVIVNSVGFQFFIIFFIWWWRLWLGQICIKPQWFKRSGVLSSWFQPQYTLHKNKKCKIYSTNKSNHCTNSGLSQKYINSLSRYHRFFIYVWRWLGTNTSHLYWYELPGYSSLVNVMVVYILLPTGNQSTITHPQRKLDYPIHVMVPALHFC